MPSHSRPQFRPATGSCGLRLQSPRQGAAPNRPGGFAIEGRSFQLPAASGPHALGRGHHPWAESAQDARQLDVAGFICQAPSRGLRLTALGGFASEGRSFQLLAAPGPIAPGPRPSSVGGNRTERPATGSCGLRLPSPLTGATPNRPRRFRNRRPQFPTAGCLRPNALRPRPASVGGATQNARQLEVAGFICQAPSRGYTEPPPAVSQAKAAVFNCRPCRGPLPPGRLTPRPSSLIWLRREGFHRDAKARTRRRNWPVYDASTCATRSGGPSATMRPPSSPPSGPKSIIQSADLITSRWCSMTITVLP